ncbi:MAG TPA: diguanylate cyclase, partial [Candidatus Nanopelagicales bacterium]|nr:diguanylate cyclase [Candidatus Nanopelagicales bacterium]
VHRAGAPRGTPAAEPSTQLPAGVVTLPVPAPEPVAAPVAAAPPPVAPEPVEPEPVAPEPVAAAPEPVAPEPVEAAAPAAAAVQPEVEDVEGADDVAEQVDADVEPAQHSASDDEAIEQWDLAAAVLAATPDLLLLFDVATSQVVSMAGSAEHAADLVERLRGGHDLRPLVHDDDREAVADWSAGFETLAEGEIRSIDARFHVDDEWRWRELRASEYRRDSTGAVSDVVIVVRDVHDRVSSTQRVAESERAFREVFDASPVGLAVLDSTGRFVDANDAFCRLAGRTREAVLSTVYEALLHPQDRAAAVITRARRLTEGTKSSSGDTRIQRADGTTVWVRVRSTDIEHDDGGRTLLSIEDVTHAKATEDQLRHDALHDELTGLPNRRLLLDRLERALLRSRRSGTRLAVYFIDLDDLKRVNDTHPWKHRAGDVLITSSASAVRDALRDADTLGRLGGDEFVAVCEDMGDDAVVDEVGARLLRAATQLLTIGTETVRPGASIGVALSEADDEDAQSLLRRADAAMYRAKAAGGSRVVRADADGRPAEPALDLSGAIARRELVQQYQPIVSLSTGAVLGVTTVIHRRGADERLPARTEAGEAPARTLPVVQWSIAQAVRDVRTVAPTRVEHVSVWIPTSARATLADSTRTAVLAALRGPDGSEGGDSAPSIVLDVPESELTMLTRRDVVQQHLDDLLETGPLAIGVAHFTADSVPLGLLQQVSAASVAIDPALLAEAAHDDGTAEVVHALVAAASALGVVTVAMDVDSAEDLETARALGVHAVYGDLVGPPAPLDTYSDLLHGGRITLPPPADVVGTDERPAPTTVPDDGGADEWVRQMRARLQEPSADKTSGGEVETSVEPAGEQTAVA